MKKFILMVVFFILVLGSSHNFIEDVFPSSVPVGQNYVFSIRNSIELTSICDLHVFDSNNNMIDDFNHRHKQCEVKNGFEVCTMAELITDANGYLTYSFYIDPDKYLVGNTYSISLECGGDLDEDESFYVSEALTPNLFFNLAFVGISNADVYIWFMFILLITLSLILLFSKKIINSIKDFIQNRG